jgi:hypothetical protein
MTTECDDMSYKAPLKDHAGWTQRSWWKSLRCYRQGDQKLMSHVKQQETKPGHHDEVKKSRRQSKEEVTQA